MKTTWAPRGQTPVILTRGHWSKISAIGALALSPRRQHIREFIHLYPGADICSEHIVGFLDELLHEVRGPIVLVWDRIQIHRSADVRDFVERHPRLTTFLLPPYAPELNPVEQLWCASKHHRLAGHGITELDELTQQAGRALVDIAQDQHLLCSFFRATPLPLRIPL